MQILQIRHGIEFHRITPSIRVAVVTLVVGVTGCLNGCSDDGKSDVEKRPHNDNLKTATDNSGGYNVAPEPAPDSDGNYHVYPDHDIQRALDRASDTAQKSTVFVHAGTYRPAISGQAFIRLTEKHDGVTLEAVGKVVLTAANPHVAVRESPTYPAIVNHVLYIGDGVSSKTTVRGFTVTGANKFVLTASGNPEPNADQPGLQPGMFFFLDGGAIKIFGRSYPGIEDMRIIDNETGLCGGGISIEHRGFKQDSVRIRNCVFRNNRCPATGAAIDVLEGSAAIIENCLFVGNIANSGMERIARQTGLEYNKRHGCGALTVFPKSSVSVRRCTFTANWNGCDDKGSNNEYLDNIFWMNTADDGSRPGSPYELDILDSGRVTGCFLNGNTSDLRGTLDTEKNVLRT